MGHAGAHPGVHDAARECGRAARQRPAQRRSLSRRAVRRLREPAEPDAGGPVCAEPQRHARARAAGARRHSRRQGSDHGHPRITRAPTASRRSSSGTTSSRPGARASPADCSIGSSTKPKASTSASSRTDGLQRNPAARTAQGVSGLRRRRRKNLSDADRSPGAQAPGRGRRHRLLRAARPQRHDGADRRPGDRPTKDRRIQGQPARGDGRRRRSAAPPPGGRRG